MGRLGRAEPFKPLVNTYRPKRFDVTMTGALTTAGALVRQSRKITAGTLTTGGGLTKRTQRALTGTLTTAGALTAVKTALVSLAGTLTTAGALVRRTGKVATSTLTTAGALTKRTAKSFAGTLTTAGALAAVKTALLSLAGTLTTAGALSRRVGKSLGGVLTTAGAVSKFVIKTFTGVLTFAGTLSGSLSGGAGGYWTDIVDINTRWRAYLEQLYSYALDGRRDVTSLMRRWLVANPTAGTDENTRLKKMDDDSKT